MATSITQINAAADTFQIWVNRTNEVINAVSTKVVTVAPTANGEVTTGNAYINGVFSAFLIGAETLRGGNVQSSSTLNVESNVFMVDSVLSIGNTTVNAIVNSTYFSINTANVQNIQAANAVFNSGMKVGNVQMGSFTNAIVNTSLQAVDTFAITTRAAEYLITLKDLNSNAHQLSKLLVIHDDGVASVTEYGIVSTNGAIGIFSASINSTAVALNITPTSNSVTVRGSRTTILG